MGDPVDLSTIEAEYPELRGMLRTVSEYVEEWERLQPACEEPHVLAPGAVLSIVVEDEPELSVTIVVPPTGEWFFPFGKMKIEGLTIPELKAQLEERLRQHGIRCPVVNVDFLGIGRRTGASSGTETGTVAIVGAEGTVPSSRVRVTGDQTLVGLLGGYGLGESAELRQIVIVRRDPVRPFRSTRIVVCDLWSFLVSADVRQDIPLLAGDVVVVPRKGTPRSDSLWPRMVGFLSGAIEPERLLP